MKGVCDKLAGMIKESTIQALSSLFIKKALFAATIVSFLLLNSHITNAGVFLFKWGSFGTGDGQFYRPSGIAIDSSDNVYVAESVNDRVQKFTSDGTFIAKWGSTGPSDGQFRYPQGVGVDSSDNVYVADAYNNRIQKFTSDGTFVTTWGSSGNGDGQFNTPWDIAIDSSENIYVSDYGNDRIQKFTSDGTFIIKWGSFGNGDSQFNKPSGIVIDSSDNVYVVDGSNNRVQKFTSDGTFVTTWGSSGNGDGQFAGPSGIAIDSSDNVYVGDRGNNRIQKFTSEGIFIAQWGSFGTGDGQFNEPQGIAVDSSDNIYVVDGYNDRIQVFGQPLPPTYEATGTWISSKTNNWVSSGSTDCIPLPDTIGVATVTQNENYVTLLESGQIWTGVVSGADYAFTAERRDTGGIFTAILAFTLSSSTSGFGIHTWASHPKFPEETPPCNGGSDIVFEAAVPPSFNANGTWTYTTTNSWVERDPGAVCVPMLEMTGTATVTQDGYNVSLVDEYDDIWTGIVSGEDYTFTIAYSDGVEITSATLMLTLSSSTSGSGTLTWWWTDGSLSCDGGSDVSYTKGTGGGSSPYIDIDPGGGGGG